MFIKYFILSTLSFLLFCSALIISVDPYSKLGVNLFNFKTKAVAFSRENKFNMLENSKNEYEAFILGSSSAHRYHTSVVKKLTGFEAFNYAVQQTTPEDYLAITRHILSRYRPKLILLQIDFYALNTNYPIDPRFESSPLKEYLQEARDHKYFKGTIFYNNYFTLEALRDSFRVIGVNLFGEARHAYEKHGDYRIEKKEKGKVRVYQFHKKHYEVSQKRLRHLEAIKKLTDDDGIKLIVFISPRSIEHYQRQIATEKARKSMGLFRKNLVNIFGSVYDFNTEKMQSFDDKKFFQNSTHPTRFMSDKILKAILKNEKLDSLGIKLEKGRTGPSL